MILAEYLAPHIFKPITSLREVITFPGYYFCMSGSRKFSQWEGAGVQIPRRGLTENFNMAKINNLAIPGGVQTPSPPPPPPHSGSAHVLYAQSVNNNNNNNNNNKIKNALPYLENFSETLSTALFFGPST